MARRLRTQCRQTAFVFRMEEVVRGNIEYRRRNVMMSSIAGVLAALLAGASYASASEPGIRIGVLNDASGPLSDITGKGSVVAAQLAVEDFGSIPGKPISIVAADHQNKADIGLGIARRWLDNENVDAIVDVPNSSVGRAVQNLTREKNKVFLITAGQLPEFFGSDCSPTSVVWTSDTFAIAKGTVTTLVKRGAKSWFFMTADFAFGHSAEQGASATVAETGGLVKGSVRYPFNTPDFASFLLQADAANTDAIGLASAGDDATRAIKQAGEFGVAKEGRVIAALALFTTDVHGLGLPAAKGTYTTESFYWDMNDETRAFSRRFMERMNGRPPTSLQASVYGAVLHYLKAVKSSGTDEAKAVVKAMKATPVNDFYTKNATIREDGRLLRDLYLFQVKSPQESKYAWDYYKKVETIGPQQSTRAMAEGGCPFVGRE